MLRTHRFSKLFAKFATAIMLVALLAISVAGAQAAPGYAPKTKTPTPPGGGATATPGGPTPTAAPATTYYVDCALGNDSNNGTSTSTPWRTMARANQQTYSAGSSILFKRGATCSGVGFKPQGNGTTASPITIADYGSGNLPVLEGNGAHEAAIQLWNSKNYVVRNLDLTQRNQIPSAFTKVNEMEMDMRAVFDIRGLHSTTGVVNCGEPCTARNITIDGLKVHGGQWNGIYIVGGHYELDFNTYGYVDNVVITNTEAWGNAKIGIDVTSTYTKQITYPSTNIKILTSYLHDNGWDGIRVGPADHVLIDSNECSYNGSLENARLGCWGWDSHDMVIQFNNSHHNVTPSTDKHARDGGGFDLDLGTEDGVMQYNWSHDNQGEGYLTMTWPIGFGYQRGVSHNTHMRYNLSERDGKKLAGAWYNFGGVENLVVHNNTLYYEPARLPAASSIDAMVCDAGATVCHDTWGAGGSTTTNYVYNNIFIATPNSAGGPSFLQWSDGTGTWNYDNNIWYRTQGGFETSGCANFACWQALGRDLNGFNANPGLTGPLGGGPAAYHLTSGSIAINRARVVTQGLRGMGTRDYFGTTTPQGGAYDIGMDEF